MALFTLTDINFGEDRRTGSAGPIVGSQYESNTYRFPLDIGNYGRGHYIVIHINVQENTNYTNYTEVNEAPTIIANRISGNIPSTSTNFGKSLEGIKQLGGVIKKELPNASEFVSSGLSSISSLTGLGDILGGMTKNYSRVEGARTIRRTSDTIALYMPDTVNFITNQHYAELTTQGLPATALAAGASLSDSIAAGKDMKGVIKNMSPFVANYFLNQQGMFGDLGKQMFAASFGMVQNPMLDVIYSTPEFRNFTFDFMFYPRSEKEAQELLKIINRLQFHQAPEVRREYGGMFLTPPSEFDVKFYYNGAENPNIQKMSTCALTSININYAPHGYSAYEVPGQTKPTFGGTGTPVAIQLQLNFKELEIMTKQNFGAGGKCETVNPLESYVEGTKQKLEQFWK